MSEISRRLLGGMLAFGLIISAAPADAQVSRGPYPDTALSRNGGLLWYTGVIDLTNRRWRELDALCASVQVAGATGWRAPTEAEVRTLFVEVPRRNAVASWTEIYIANADALTPAVPIFVAMGPHGIHPHMNILLRDLYTYDGQRTTLGQVRRGPMYVIRWFNRWTRPALTREQSITHMPGDRPLGSGDRLLCVTEIRAAS